MANRNIERAVRVALLTAGAVSVGAFSSAALAQTGDEVEQIIVTGSRIPQPNIEGNSPVTTVGAQDFQLAGVSDTVNLINSLPQAFAAQASGVSNGASGTSTLDLRSLGSTRTLVLVNGRRMPAGDPSSISGISPDINMIPAALVSRVEVLTGGAGAVYGSDAVAGVVNFIMKDDFEGVEVGGQYSFYNHDNKSDDNAGQMYHILGNKGFAKPPNTASDGDTYDLSILMGSNFADGKGNATMFIGYRNTDAVLQGDRIGSACALQTNASGATTGTGNGKTSYFRGARCGGSGTNATGSYYNANLYPLNPLTDPFPPDFPAGQIPAPYFDGPFTVTPEGVPGAAPLYNYAPLNYFQRPDERWSAAVFMNYEVNDQVEAYGEFMFMDDHTVAQIAPSGIFSNYYDVPCSGVSEVGNAPANPLINQAWLDTLCASYNQIPIDPEGDLTDPGNYTTDYSNPQYVTEFGHTFMQRRNVEGGPRQDDLRHTDYRGVIGIRGKIFEHWNYDLFGQYGTTILSEHVNNYVSNQRAKYALDVIAGPDGPVCAGAATYAPGCVPWDIWNPGGVTPEALDYINIQGFSSGSTEQTVVNGTMSADLGDYGITMPWATSGVGVAFGIEYRQENLQLDYDLANITGDLGGGSGVLLPVHGSYNLMDYFAEARVPIVEDVAFAKSLVFNGSYRYSDYSTNVNTNTYGLGLDWAPMDDFKLRGSFQHAVRAPNVLELFTPQAVGLYDWNEDPCGKAAPGELPTASLSDCLFTGMTSGQYGNVPQSPAQQYNANFGGDTSIKPETADTWTVGIVLTPTFLEGFTMTIDYFNIKVSDLISSISPTTTVANCLEFHDPYFCDNIHRDAGGSLWLSKDGFVNSITTNLGYIKTTGTDFNINYNLGLGDWGSLNFNELATWLDSYEIEEIPHYGSYDCKGLYGQSKCGTPFPEWKSKFQTIWSTPWNVDLSLTWRYIDSVMSDQYDSSVCGNECAPHPFDKTLASQNYFDLGGTYAFAERYTINAGIMNLLDESPPISSSVGAGFGNGNTYPGTYDALGRYLFVGLTAKF